MARGRPRLVEPNIDTHVYIPESLYNKLTILLWSELEARVPYGQMSTFMVTRAKEYFATEPLDLSAAFGEVEGTHVIRGSAETLALVKQLLKGGKP